MLWLVALAGVASAAAAQSLVEFTATRLRVEYAQNPISIDTPTPKFSYALSHPQRGQYQTAYQIQVSKVDGSSSWDSGKIASNRTLNIVYGGTGLTSDTDYSWTVTWWDSTGAMSTPASATFSVALLNPTTDFAGAIWLSSNGPNGTGSLNTYRSAPITLPATPVRARLYVAGMGYAKTWINGQLTDDHELGTFTTFEKRVLYDVIDVTQLLHDGCNTFGIMLGHGWFAQPTVKSGARQFLLMLSVTAADGSVTYYPSSLAGNDEDRRNGDHRSTTTSASTIVPLTFQATAGPVVQDDIYVGESYDGRVDLALKGWSTCAYTPQPGTVWTPAIAPVPSPATLGSTLSSHSVPIRTDKTFTIVPGGPSIPGPGQFVYDFGQNMAGQVTLKVNDCPAGTQILIHHAEILWPNGSAHNHYGTKAPMIGNYTCGGNGGLETYRYLFTYMGFRYVQLEGFPGIPGEDTLVAHFIHSDVPQTGEFSSSSSLLNQIQHATRYASWSNLMDIPTDCPQRERRGWLGDAQLSFETQIHNADGGAFYSKWIRDFTDAQEYDNVTYGSGGAMPDCIPYYGHGHLESDPGWGIAAWNIPDAFAQYYADDSFEAAYYPNLRWYMEHWVALAANNTNASGIFPITWWGDWGEYYPGPYQHRTADYADFFYVQGMKKTLGFAQRLNVTADVQRYSTLLADAQQLYLKTYYNATTYCFVDCMYVSQIFGLSLGLFEQGSPEEAAVWANAVSWFDENGINAKYPEHFGGGIISLALVYPLLDRFGLSGLGLRFQLQDTVPSFGYWIQTTQATTLVEAWPMTATGGGYSYNHIMFGGSGSWYYKTLAGLGRADNSRSWSNLVIAPPTPASQVMQNLSWAGASIDTPMGLVSSAWQSVFDGNTGTCGYAEANADLALSCENGVFTGIQFASYGTPQGDCATGFVAQPACDANTTISTITAACIGKQNCTLVASNTFFNNDPCPGVQKALAVNLTGTCKTASSVYNLQVTIPVNAVATVAVPSMLSPSQVTITETIANATVWSHGSYIPGCPGVASGALSGNGEAVVFDAGSGSYSFLVTSS